MDNDILDALKLALPQLEENYRWHRDMQSHASKVMAASEAVDAVKWAIEMVRKGLLTPERAREFGFEVR